MSTCNLNTGSYEYQRVKQLSGVHDSVLEPLASNHIAKYGRLPYLDEIPGANSENYLRNEYLKTGKKNSIKTENLLKITGKQSVTESIHTINDVHRDLEFNALELGSETIFTINKRPDSYHKTVLPVESDVTNGKIFYDSIVDRLSSIYGLPINTITSAEIAANPELAVLPEATNAGVLV